MTNDILITAAGGFMGKYLADQLRRSIVATPAPEVHYAGTSPFNDYIVNLATETFTPGRSYRTVYHLLGGCFEGDLEMLNVVCTRNLLASLEEHVPQSIVYLSSTDVYGVEEGEAITEEHATNPVSIAGKSKLEAEEMLRQWCADKGVTLSILRCPPIVGTGMKGPLRRLVNSIYRGNYHHIDDETSRLSVVHATDVARAMVMLADVGGIYNITDGVNPSRHDLVEALARRMKSKRVYTLRAKRARIVARICDFLPGVGYGRKVLAQRYRTLTFDDSRLQQAINFTPTSVVEYLTTHNYDENSL